MSASLSSTVSDKILENDSDSRSDQGPSQHASCVLAIVRLAVHLYPQISQRASKNGADAATDDTVRQPSWRIGFQGKHSNSDERLL